MLSQLKPLESSESGEGSLTLILRSDIFISCPRCHTNNARHKPVDKIHTLIFLNKEKFNSLLSNERRYQCTVCGNQIEI